MLTNHDQKRSDTPYGTVKYDTIQCAECTNDTVPGELTHLFVTTVANLQGDGTDPIGARPVCHGCLKEWYDFDTVGPGATVFSHDTLCEFYADEWQDADTFSTSWCGLWPTETTHPTPHGPVSITVGQCARCGDERSVDDLCVAGLPIDIKNDNNQLRINARYYCPDCQETSLLALQGDGPTLATVAETGEFEKGHRQSDSIRGIRGLDLDAGELPNPQAWFKIGSGLFLGGFLLTMIFMSVGFETLAAVVWIFTFFSTLVSLGVALLAWVVSL